MFYRRKYYMVKKEIVESFNQHFNQTLLPAQLKYGTRLIGRWLLPAQDDLVEIFAIWEYDSREAYESIEAQVRGDQAHIKRVQAWYEKHGGKEHVIEKYIIEIKNEEIINTVI